jgi:histidinol phosphatase-like enzyme
MRIFIDIDETICRSPNKDYTNSVPIKENIDKANKLYEQGNYIVYWTARGSSSGIDWTQLTHEQLKNWGVKFHELRLGKPSYDLFIDDKALNVIDWK